MAICRESINVSLTFVTRRLRLDRAGFSAGAACARGSRGGAAGDRFWDESVKACGGSGNAQRAWQGAAGGVQQSYFFVAGFTPG